MSLNVSPQYHSPRSPLRRRFPSSANTPHASRPVYWIYCFPWQGRCYVGFCPGAMLSNLSMGMARGKSLRRQHVNMVVSWNRHGEDQTNRDGVGLQRFHHIGPLTVGKGKKKKDGQVRPGQRTNGRSLHGAACVEKICHAGRWSLYGGSILPPHYAGTCISRQFNHAGPIVREQNGRRDAVRHCASGYGVRSMYSSTYQREIFGLVRRALCCICPHVSRWGCLVSAELSTGNDTRQRSKMGHTPRAASTPSSASLKPFHPMPLAGRSDPMSSPFFSHSLPSCVPRNLNIAAPHL